MVTFFPQKKPSSKKATTARADKSNRTAYTQAPVKMAARASSMNHISSKILFFILPLPSVPLYPSKSLPECPSHSAPGIWLWNPESCGVRLHL